MTVLSIPNAVGNLGACIVAIIVGTVVSAVALGFLKRPVVSAMAPAR